MQCTISQAVRRAQGRKAGVMEKLLKSLDEVDVWFVTLGQALQMEVRITASYHHIGALTRKQYRVKSAFNKSVASPALISIMEAL